MKIGLVLVFVLLLHVVSFAQTDVNRLRTALEEYRVGRFREVISMLEHVPVSGKSEEQLQVFRLLALTYLAMDNREAAEKNVVALLRVEPYYTPSMQDPVRFVEMLHRLRQGEVTLVTASQQAESVDDAPVPVTLITAAMLEDIGARTLKDALIVYVPSMMSVESANEVNVAMRGVYSSGQQKILLMINGHRLNSRSTNGANPDYSISLDKIRQIEVLRGPASSLYGNVALTAVVNMITKDGNEAGGVRVSGGVGNFGQRRADILFGRRFMDMDVTVWASLYRADGQMIVLPALSAIAKDSIWRCAGGQVILGGYKDLPSYDAGFTYRWNNFSAMLNLRYCKMIDPFATVGKAIGAFYTYDRYRNVGGEGIGYGSHNTHSELAWEKRVRNWKVDVCGYFDLNINNQNSTIGDSIAGEDNALNVFQIANWRENVLGGVGKVSLDYEAGRCGKGDLLIGVQAEHLNVYDAYGLIGKNYNSLYYSWEPLKTGKEDIYSCFGQVRHRFHDRFMVNIGMRFDHKVRVDHQKIFACSPRFSFIYKMNSRRIIKLSYARSFVDAPYFYRCNALPTYRGSDNLQSEYLSAVQLSYTFHSYTTGFSYEGNFFYNHLTDFIYQDKSATGDMPRYRNAGRLDLLGWENTLVYSIDRFRSNLNISAQIVTDGENFDFRGKRIYNVPPVTISWVNAVKVLQGRDYEVWLKLNARFQSRQLSPIYKVYMGGQLKESPDNMLPASCVFNGGFSSRWKQFIFSLHAYNLTNHNYYQGGTTVIPYRQQGLSLVAKLGYSFGK